MPIPLKPETQRKIIELHLNNVPVMRIAKQLGVHRSTIRRNIDDYLEATPDNLDSYMRREIKPSKFINEANRYSGIPDIWI